MSLFQCDICGCVENTALSSQGIGKFMIKHFDWSDIEDRKGKMLCSACGPKKYSDLTSTKLGEWHGEFERIYLPMGKFKTNRIGNLENIKTGDTDYMKHKITKPGTVS